jgi:glycosyltransferase involved in cell wall biosynthesis
MLNDNGIDSKLVHVVDNNFIDREVKAYKPTHVIIEAYWVVPEKFDILQKLHPGVKWIVRDHSKSEFLSNEGMAFGWTLDYLARGVEVAANSTQAFTDMTNLAIAAGYDPELVTYLPNYYPLVWENVDSQPECFTPGWDFSSIPAFLEKLFGKSNNEYPEATILPRAVVDIGCFGAIRPLKNTLNQALAAVLFAQRHNLRLRFHINGNRIEGNGSPIKKNIFELFDRLKYRGYELVDHAWLDHEKFLELTSTMDIVSQVAFSETFNIVGADAVAMGVPVIGSDEIPWLPIAQCADPNNVEEIAEKYAEALDFDTDLQWDCLHHYSKLSEELWVDRFGQHLICD